MPYRTHENRVDGVVITLTDITVSKVLEAALRKAQSDLEARFTQAEASSKPSPSSMSKTPSRPPPGKQSSDGRALTPEGGQDE